MSEWQPIETAPRDGTEVIIAIRHHRRSDPAWTRHIASYEIVDTTVNGKSTNRREGWKLERVWEVLQSPRDDLPIYWMPLPEPPK